MASNAYYNDALEKAAVRDLSGAIESLRTSLRFYKMNIDARNLLGLVYFETGEVVEALTDESSARITSRGTTPQAGI